MRPDLDREAVAERLREALRAADRELPVPPGLWERISAAPRPQPVPPRRPRLRARATLAAVACVVAAVVSGAWWLTGSEAPAERALPAAVPLTVHNAEVPCQPLRTLECALRLARDPTRPYAADDNTAARVWHGQRLWATCVITHGRLVTDESGITSTRWYLVTTDTTDTTAQGWLPGVRTRNSAEIPLCTPEQAATETTRFTPP